MPPESATITTMGSGANFEADTTSPAPGFYDLVAPIYDRHWGRAFFSSAARQFRQHLAPRIPSGARILDLCCGSGRFASFLVRRGYHVAGTDSSPALLARAAAGVPGARFVHAEMHRFALNETFDAAVCWFNSLNHASDEHHLTRTFSCVAQHLAPSAPFLFDVIPEADYLHCWKNEECVLAAEAVYELSYSYQPTRRLATCRVRVRSRDTSQPIREAVSEQRPLDLSVLESALRRAGFRLVFHKILGRGHPPQGRRLLLAERC